WRALAVTALPGRPSGRLVGLGGGPAIHLLPSPPRPRLSPVIERDHVIARVAGDWFGLDTAGPLEILCADAMVAVRGLARERRRFDFVMEDVAYGDTPERAARLALGLAPLVAPRGTLVVNRHRRAGARGLARVLRARFGEVEQGLLERAQRVHVEVVRRLVEQQEVRAAPEHGGQVQPVALAPREVGHALLLVASLEVERGDVGTRRHRPAAERQRVGAARDRL